MEATSKSINLVFIGEAGAGKTTLFTALKDYAEGKSFEERSIMKQL
jgi:GTPase SAR1 family protein